MFGADTPLMMDALQIMGITAAVSVGAAVIFMRRSKRAGSRGSDTLESARPEPTNLEERVRVLERIATDRPAELAEEIEALRAETAPDRTKELTGKMGADI